MTDPARANRVPFDQCPPDLQQLFPNGLSDDCLLEGRVRLWQPVGGYRVAVDPVLLAAATPALPGETVGDFGTGSGAVGLCLAARVAQCRVVGFEREADMAALAWANVRRNGMVSSVFVLQADVSAPPFARQCFDHVSMNPPYLAAGTARPPSERLRRIASVEGTARLTTWLTSAWDLVRPGGSITLIHRADRLDEIVSACRCLQEGGLTIIPIWPKPGLPAHRVVVRLRRGDRSPTLLAAGIILHDHADRFTDSADAILRHATHLTL